MAHPKFQTQFERFEAGILAISGQLNYSRPLVVLDFRIRTW